MPHPPPRPTDGPTRPVPEVVLGIDIGGTGTRFVAADPSTLEVTARTTVPTPTRATSDDILRFLTEQIDHVGLGRRPIAVGIGASGPVDRTGVIRNPDTLPAFTDLPLLEMIGGIIDGPVAIDNDAVCAALAEQQVGAAQHSPRSLHITLGTGVGVCLLENDAPFRLPDGTHPEGGHIAVAVSTTPCYCGRPQCWEQAASRRNLQRTAAGILGRSTTDRTVIAELAARAEQGDATALAAYDDYGQGVANGLGTLLALYGPDTVVIGGSGAEHLDLYLSAITQALAALNGWIPEHRIVKTQLDDHGGAIGGARLAKSALGSAE